MLNQELVEVLDAALVKLEHGWCQGSYARGSDGSIRAPSDSDACSWCSVGAISAVTPFGIESHDLLWGAMRLLTACLPPITGAPIAPTAKTRVVQWNDNPNRTKYDVIALFRQARDRASTPS